MMLNTETHAGKIAVLRSFTAGFVDTAGFVALFGLFTAHVTGNFVLIGASLAESRSGVLGKLLALPVFVLAVALTSIFVRACERQERDATPFVLLGEAIFLSLFMAAGLYAAPFTDGDQPSAIVTGMCGVMAMGIQNAGARTIFSHLSPTTVMTGNVTQVVMDLTDWASLRQKGHAVRGRIRKMVPPVVAFAVGAIAGGVGFGVMGFWCLCFPIAAVFIVLAIRPRAT